MTTTVSRPAGVLGAVGERVSGVRRLAVLRSGGIGDLVLALPALAALRAAYPEAELTLLGSPVHAELLAGRPGPWDRVLPVTRRTMTAQREHAYDLAVRLSPDLPAEELGAGSVAGGAPRDRSEHEVLRLLELAGTVGAEPVSLEPSLAVTDADRAAASGLVPDGGYAVLLPGGADPRRRWPVDSFAAVAAALDVPAVLAGSADDAPVTAALAARLRTPAVDLAGRLDLPALVGVLARASVVIGNASGPLQLAAAVGAATVGVYRGSAVLAAGPLCHARHRVAVSSQTACPVCGLAQAVARCGHDPSYVSAVPAAEVRDHVLDLLG